MRRINKLAILLMVIALFSAMMMTACGSKSAEKSEPTTLEAFINEHPDVKSELDKKVADGETSGVAIEIKGNDIIYTYDLSGVKDMTEEFAKSDDLKEALQTALDSQADAFRSVASRMESVVNDADVEIKGIRVVVNYVYGDEVVVSGTFEPSDEAAAPAEEAPEATEEAAEEAVEEEGSN